jgi:DNA-binding response OmpR family regulator
LRRVSTGGNQFNEAPQTSISEPDSQAKPEITGDVLRFEGWKLDVPGQRLWAPKNREIEITSGECNLLEVFARNARRTLSRAEIEAKRKARPGNDEHSIVGLIRHLRRKLELHAGGAKLIKTVRGEGYLFWAEVTDGTV